MQKLTHGSLFSGIGGIDLGFEWAGFETVFQVEINPFCNKILETRWPNVPRFLDVKSVGKHNLVPVDLISGGFPCFADGTLILTYGGFKPIESVIVGDIVLTHKGRWKKVTSVMSREAETCRLVSAQGILPTTTTDEHPYYSRKRLFPPDWIDAGNLEKSSLLAQVLPPMEDDSHTEEFWWVVGRYLADGWLAVCNGKGRAVICANYGEADEVEKHLYAAGFSSCKDEDRTVVKFHVTRKAFYEFLLPFGKYAEDKLLPGWVLSLPENKARSLLNGYFTGDGDQYKNRSGKIGGRRATTVSPALSLGMALLVQRGYGVVASVHRQEVPPTTVIEGRTVNQKTQYIAKFSTNQGRKRQAFIEGDYGWKPVRKTEVTHGRTVRNISVEDDESYIANGAIVHNCQDLSVAAGGKERGLHLKRSGLWFEYARIVRELQPRWVLVENVPNLKTKGADTVISDLEAAGYSCWASVVGAEAFGAPFQRERVFILAHHNSYGTKRLGEDVGSGWTLSPELERSLAQACQNWRYWEHELGAGNARSSGEAEESESDTYARGVGTVYGVPNWTHRLRALGNACIPTIPALIGSFIQNYEQS